jgi:hypothetical protein
MPTYDTERASPPAPFALVTLRNPHHRKSVVDVPMLLDTGADVSLIPLLVVEALEIVTMSAEGIRLVGFDGTASASATALVEMRFLEKTFRGEFLIVDGTYGIMGRDILNLVCLTFDGPNLTWTEAKNP